MIYCKDKASQHLIKGNFTDFKLGFDGCSLGTCIWTVHLSSLYHEPYVLEVLEDRADHDNNLKRYEQPDDLIWTELLHVMSCGGLFQVEAGRHFNIEKAEWCLIPFIYM